MTFFDDVSANLFGEHVLFFVDVLAILVFEDVWLSSIDDVTLGAFVAVVFSFFPVDLDVVAAFVATAVCSFVADFVVFVAAAVCFLVTVLMAFGAAAGCFFDVDVVVMVTFCFFVFWGDSLVFNDVCFSGEGFVDFFFFLLRFFDFEMSSLVESMTFLFLVVGSATLLFFVVFATAAADFLFSSVLFCAIDLKAADM